MRRYLVEIFFGEEQDQWKLPEPILHLILLMSGLIRQGGRSASFVIFEPRRVLRLCLKGTSATDAKAREEEKDRTS